VSDEPRYVGQHDAAAAHHEGEADYCGG
jgi:hypothetical protein